MIITITNQKGGCGKTTTAQTLCAGLAKRGFRVLAIDADPQANFTYSAGIGKLEGNLHDLLTGAKKTADCITETPGGFDLIAGSIFLTNTGSELKADNLKKALQEVKSQYDYIAIDTPPALGMLTANALIASDCVIIPMGADVYSMQGLAQLQGMIANARKHNPELYIAGILLTRYTARTIINRQIKKDLERVAARLGTKLFKATIREATAVKEVQLMKTDLFREYPKANVTKDFEAFIDEFLKVGA